MLKSVRACIHTCIRACIHTCMHAYIIISLSQELGPRLFKLDHLPSLDPVCGMPFPSLCVRLYILDHCLHLSLSLSLLKTYFFSRGSRTGSATERLRL